MDEQGEARLQGLQNLLPAIEQNLGAHPEMVETIMALSQGGGSGAGSVQQGPGGSLLLQTGKGTFSVLKGVDKPESPADVALARQRNASAKSDELYHELLEGIKGEKVNTSGMSEQDKRTVVKLESEIEQSQNNIEMLEGLRKKNVSYANWDGEEVVGEAEVDEISMFNAVIGEKSTSSSLTSEKQKLKKLQKQLNKLRGESGGAAIPAPPLSFDDSPENLFAE